MLFDIILSRISDVLHVSKVAILLRGSNVFHLQQALGLEFGGPVAFAEGSATIQNLQRTNQPATVYHDRPEPWFIEAAAKNKPYYARSTQSCCYPWPAALIFGSDRAGTQEVRGAVHTNRPAYVKSVAAQLVSRSKSLNWSENLPTRQRNANG